MIYVASAVYFLWRIYSLHSRHLIHRQTHYIEHSLCLKQTARGAQSSTSKDLQPGRSSYWHLRTHTSKPFASLTHRRYLPRLGQRHVSRRAWWRAHVFPCACVGCAPWREFLDVSDIHSRDIGTAALAHTPTSCGDSGSAETRNPCHSCRTRGPCSGPDLASGVVAVAAATRCQMTLRRAGSCGSRGSSAAPSSALQAQTRHDVH